MKGFVKIIALGAVFAASSSMAFADSIQVSGGDTFDATGITFNPSTGIISDVQSSAGAPGGQFAPFLYTLAHLQSFNYASAAGTKVLTSTASGTTLTFTIDSLGSESISSNMNGSVLNLSGLGTFTETGNVNETMSGTFSLTSSAAEPTNVDFGFQLIGAPRASVTPEPSSLVLLGSGLASATGMMFRRRRNGAV